MEKRNLCLLKSIEDQGEICGIQKNDLYPSGSKPEVLNRLAKIRKIIASEDETPSFRAIRSAITRTA